MVPVPRATVACQCSQATTRDQPLGGATGHTCFSAAAAALFAPRVPRHRRRHTDNPANEGAAAPEGAWPMTLECSKGSWPVGTLSLLFGFFV